MVFLKTHSLLTQRPRFKMGLPDSRLGFHLQFPFQKTPRVWAPSVGQLFCHASSPEPLCLSSWVIVATPPVCLRCYLYCPVYSMCLSSESDASNWPAGAHIPPTVKGQSLDPGRFRAPNCDYRDFICCTIPRHICPDSMLLAPLLISLPRTRFFPCSLASVFSLHSSFILVLVISLLSPSE